MNANVHAVAMFLPYFVREGQTGAREAHGRGADNLSLNCVPAAVVGEPSQLPLRIWPKLRFTEEEPEKKPAAGEREPRYAGSGARRQPGDSCNQHRGQ